MGDPSPYIARTYSQPISYANQEDHCYRALTSSYSFGRYESDLDWGKWSCFTQNRCLEEVQKLSKPGTVAAMKSYFEARYKRVANKKSAAVLPNQQNEVPCESHDPGVMKIHNNSQMISDLAKFSKDVSCYVTKENDCLKRRFLSNYVKHFNVVAEANDTGNALKDGEVNTKLYGFVESSTEVDSSKQHGNGQKHSSVRFTKETRTLSKNNADKGDLTPSSTRKSASSSSKASISGGTSKLRAPVPPRKENKSSPNINTAARDSIVKRRSPLESLHKSLSYDSCASEAKKTSSPILDSIRNLRIVKSFGRSSKYSTTKQAPTRERLHGVATCNSETPHRENISCVESSSVGRRNPSSTVFSSLSFQCEEKGARHKEKLENKLNLKETEKAPLQTKSKPHSSELGRKPPPRQGQDSASSRPRSESSGKTQLKVCYRKE